MIVLHLAQQSSKLLKKNKGKKKGKVTFKCVVTGTAHQMTSTDNQLHHVM